MRGAISSTTRAYASPLALECEAAWARLVLAFKAFVQVAIKAGFNPGQPRMPAGNRDGGQWTSSGGSIGGGLAHLASSRRQTVRVRVGRSYHDATPAQSMRLANAAAWARTATNRVREIEPSWRPRPSLTETIEGEIRALEAAAREANALMRAAQVHGGTLSGREIEMRTDRELCWSCETLLPRIALQLGNPDVRIIDGTGMLWILRDGIWIEGPGK
ncbi:MAG: hypothetical protein AB7U75_21145 [Hyphomicrobiaceae bacterium]